MESLEPVGHDYGTSQAVGPVAGFPTTPSGLAGLSIVTAAVQSGDAGAP